MSTYGIGQGIERGVAMASDAIGRGMQMKQRKDQIDMQLIAADAWARGLAQRGLAFEEDPSTGQPSAGTLPRVPSSQPIETTGKLGIPLSQFEVGSPVARGPMPAASVRPPIDSPAALLAFPPIARRPRLRTGY